MKKMLFVLSALGLLGGCSTTVNPTFTATGNPGYRLVCGGPFGDGDMGSCYQKAGELCTVNGYRVLQTSVSSLIVECRESGSGNGEADLIK
jgi:hypothetical protein